MVEPTVSERALLALLTPDAEERAELTAAGVPRATVNRLYPLELDRLLTTALARAKAHGLWNLRADTDIPLANWESSIGQATRVRDALPAHERAAYEVQWASWWAANAHGRLSEMVYSELRMWHTASNADYFTGWYLRAVFLSYWVLTHGQPSGEQATTAALLNWVAKKLLPGENGRA